MPGAGAQAGEDGFWLRSGDGAWRLRLGGYVQFDGRFFPGNREQPLATAPGTFLLRRVRPIVQGTVARHFDFYLAPDFGGGAVVLQDAYLDVRYTPRLRVRAGKFKEPFGLERLVSGTALLFVERALPTSLAPNRDVGVQAHGALAGERVSYALGLFNGAPDGGSVDLDTNDGKDLAGRLVVRPGHRRRGGVLGNLGLGLAVTHGQQDGPLPAYKTGGQATFFSYEAGARAHGARTRLSPQVSWSCGPVSLFGEWVASGQDVRPAAGSPAAHLTHRAWQAAVAMALTGEEAAPGALRPRRAFEPGRGWGALELVARVSRLDLDRRTFAPGLADPSRSARRATAWGLGLNWYLSRNVKQAASYERTTFVEGAANGRGRPPENALFVRTQVSF